MQIKNTIVNAAIVHMSIARWVAQWLRRLHASMVHALQRAAGSVLAAGPLPQHVAFVMDGNRRFADRLRMPVDAGHQHGYSKVCSTCSSSFCPSSKNCHAALIGNMPLLASCERIDLYSTGIFPTCELFQLSCCVQTDIYLRHVKLVAPPR